MVPLDSYVLLLCEYLADDLEGYLAKFSGRTTSDQIVLGSIVTRCPSMSLAPSALVQLDSACELFSKAAPGFRANKVLVSRA